MTTAEKISKYERLNEITDELNSLFQDSFIEEIKSGEAYYKDCCSTESLIRLWFIQLQSRYEKQRHRLRSHLQLVLNHHYHSLLSLYFVT